MNKLIALTVGAIPGILLLALINGFPVACAMLWLWWRKRSALLQNRRHPLKTPLLRPAGHSTRLKSEEALLEFMTWFQLAIVLPLMVGCVHLWSVVYQGVSRTGWGTYFSVVVAISLAAYSVKRGRDELLKRRDYRLGWEGELATAEGLAPVVAVGYKVFHDFPGDGFNIDHIVVGPSGVFAVETKVRTKRGTEKDAHKVSFDGRSLRFPAYVTDSPLIQAERQALSLGKWLTQAAGFPVTAVPVVSIPGWWVERTGKGKVVVLNPQNAVGYFRSVRDGAGLSEQQINQISYQLEQKCRDVTLSDALL